MTDNEKIQYAIRLFLEIPGSCWCGGPKIRYGHLAVCEKIDQFITENKTIGERKMESPMKCSIHNIPLVLCPDDNGIKYWVCSACESIRLTPRI